MNLELSDEQRLLRDMIDRFVSERYSFEQRARIARTPAGWSREIWAELAGLGLLMLPFAAADGGLGGGGVELMLVGEAMGRALMLEPYLACAVLSGTILRACGDAVRAQALPGLIAGETVFALTEGREVYHLNGRLVGRAPIVLAGDAADRLIVAARDAEGRTILLLLEAFAHGVERRIGRLHGGGGVADIIFHGVPSLVELAKGEDADRLIDRANAAALAFTAAEAVGAMQAVFDLTVAYLKTRIQFGAPLGANQALQHRAAEMFVELEQARSAAMYAAVTVDTADSAERDRALSAVKIVIDRAARFIGQQSVQLHGGIGVSDEYAAGHYFMRLNAITMMFGDADVHAARLAEAGGFISPLPY